MVEYDLLFRGMFYWVDIEDYGDEVYVELKPRYGGYERIEYINFGDYDYARICFANICIDIETPDIIHRILNLIEYVLRESMVNE